MDKLIDTTKCNTRLLSKLQAAGVLCKEDLEEIDAMGGTPTKQSHKLYTIILTRVDAFYHLVEGLLETNQSGAVNILFDGTAHQDECGIYTETERKKIYTEKYARSRELAMIVYQQGMEKKLQFGSLTQYALEKAHEKFTQQSLKKFYKAATGLLLVNESKGVLERCIEEAFKQYKKKNKRWFQEDVEAQVGFSETRQEFVTESDSYRSSADVVTPQKVLIGKCSSVVDRKIRSSRTELNNELLGKFERFSNSYSNVIKGNLEMISERQQLKLSQLLVYIKPAYDEEMTKQIKSNLYPNVCAMNKLHKEVVDRTIDDHTKRHQIQVSSEQRQNLVKYMQDSVTKYLIDFSINLSNQMDDPAIGIDLGTTYCCVAVIWRGQKLKIIPSSEGADVTPSYVAFQENGNHVVGQTAKDSAYRNPESTILEYRRVDGSKHLGGKDFDKNLMDECIRIFEMKSGINLFEYKNSEFRNIREDARRMIRRLQTYCEEAKCQLSSAKHATISIDSLAFGLDFHEIITRTKFEKLNRSLFRKTIEIVDNALKGAKIRKNEIDEILLVGGSTRIPKIKELLTKYFKNKRLGHSVNPDVAVAYGATIQAALLNGACTEDLLKFKTIRDITPMSLGVSVSGNLEKGVDQLYEVVPRNTEIPHTATAYLHSAISNQNIMKILVYQGDQDIATDNSLLGILDIPPCESGKERINVTIEIDKMGIIHSYLFLSTKETHKLTTEPNKDRQLVTKKMKIE